MQSLLQEGRDVAIPFLPHLHLRLQLPPSVCQPATCQKVKYISGIILWIVLDQTGHTTRERQLSTALIKRPCAIYTRQLAG